MDVDPRNEVSRNGKNGLLGQGDNNLSEGKSIQIKKKKKKKI